MRYLIAMSLLLFSAIPSFSQTCSSMPGGDIGAKVNAFIDRLPNGGSADCSQGFKDVEVMTTPVSFRGKSVNLILNRGTRILVNTGSAAAFTIENSLDSSIQGMNLDGQSSSAIGIDVRGSWYPAIREGHIQNFTQAGIIVQPGERGTYIWKISEITSEKNYVNLMVLCDNPRGVTYGILDRFWSAFAQSDGIIFKNVTRTQIMGTTLIGGGSSYNKKNGLVLDAAQNSGMDLHIESADFEGNGQDAIVDNHNVISVVGVNVSFSENGNRGRNYIAHAQSSKINTLGETFISSNGGGDTPAKHVLTIQGPNHAVSGTEQLLPPIAMRFTTVGDMMFEGAKTAQDQILLRYRNTLTSQWMGWNAGNNSLLFSGGQSWAPGEGGEIRFPAKATTLAGVDTADTLSNKTLDKPALKFPTVATSSISAVAVGYITAVVNGETVYIPYYKDAPPAAELTPQQVSPEPPKPPRRKLPRRLAED
jgi:hypothetical protein